MLSKKLSDIGHCGKAIFPRQLSVKKDCAWQYLCQAVEIQTAKSPPFLTVELSILQLAVTAISRTSGQQGWSSLSLAG